MAKRGPKPKDATTTSPKKLTPVAPRAPRRHSSRRQQLDGKPDLVDIHVGSRIRIRRILLGMTQEMLGNALGLTFQQVQKYERGGNRVSASRLYDLGQALDVPLSFFFDDMPEETLAGAAPKSGQSGIAAELSPLMKHEGVALVRAYYAIPEPKIRAQVYALAKSLAAKEED
jgi:transcriptional regulator with XRE-family HTH domain